MTSVLTIDDYDLSEASEVVADYGSGRYGYVVTPNVDHVIRHYDDSQFRSLYHHASYVLLDSRLMSRTCTLMGKSTPRVCLGSDLTHVLLTKKIKSLDRVVLVGGTAAQAEYLRSKFQLVALHHVDPPMNFIQDAEAVEACLRSIEAASPFRFCFLAIGSPQQEVIAYKLKERGVARGLALCVGAAINFMTGAERRAPLWMQKLGIEWLYRLIQNPRRMARRYLVRGPRIFFLLPQMEIRLRRASGKKSEPREFAPAPTLQVSSAPIIETPSQAA
ncbi:MAG TPA: WecB/TagA/CpsF family glycosyltransferase [Steroidobacteraceae bacterium]|jgi:exopolysaccharide biosynthesis WecB/TagA/CpsF family protein|nr:WecB/TagA/CpsF family glycosyltransferase [Steroidobacteraceae bacterium]